MTTAEESVEDVQGAPAGKSNRDEWKEAMSPRTWADSFLDELFPDEGFVAESRLAILRGNLLTLAELRFMDVKQSLPEAIRAGMPKYVTLALTQMASSSTEIARNRDGADVATLIELTERAMQNPVVPIR